MKNKFKKLAVATAMVGAAASAFATPIIGTANLSFGQVLVTLGVIDFNPDVGGGPSPTDGIFFSNTAANTGSFKNPVFTAGPSLTQGAIRDITGFPGPNFFPTGVPVSIANFVTFNAQPGWLFTAEFLVPGQFGGPVLLTQQGTSAFASIAIIGTACDTGGDSVCNLIDDKTPFTLSLSTQYTNETVAGVIATIFGGGALDNNTWSGTLTTSKLPEPGGLALLGLGLVGVAALRRKSL